ncbi:DUF4394 domain-containing protein [Actinokineospora auranticolor]|uniref:DUF4394 domain-containing protein n=1 Tax=Actinokineospora auranticolor TaxID=155976 RepID=UPI0035A8A5F3
MRIVGDTGQNLRHNIDDGTTVADPALNTPPATDATAGVTAAAYTNNDLDPDTATTLFDLNTATDQVVVQSPANSGQLAPTGGLGVDAGNAGLDIYSDLVDGKPRKQTAYAVFTPSGGISAFYTINLLTGAASKVGKFPDPLVVGDVSVALDTAG